MDYLEFIARVTSHIPDKGPSYPPIIEDKTSFKPSRGWAEMIKKVYEVDPLLCPKCEGQMSIIAFIEDHKVIKL